MVRLNLKLFRQIDWMLVGATFFLTLFSLVSIYSISLGRGNNDLTNLKKQAIWLMIGLVLMFVFAVIDYRLWRQIGWLGYAVSIMLLLLVLTPLGSVVNGARGWFNLGLFSFQPVETLKIFLIMVLADISSRYSRLLYKFRHLIFLGAVVALPAILVSVQPDFGSAMVLFVIWLASFLFIVKNKWHAIALLGLIAVIALAGWLFVLQGYQKDRILTFLDPARDPQGRGYNVRQSVIGVGAGRLFGRGLGFGSQSQLKFIPESETDFIFAVIGEEFGFVGVAMLLGLYAIFFYRLYVIASLSADDFGMFMALFFSAMVAFHVLINVGMCVGLLPVTGISLPFVSYGGSFLMTMMVLVGINLSVYRYGTVSRQQQSISMIG